MELDKSLAVLAAFEKLYCLERNLDESPKGKHPFLNTAAGKLEDGIRGKHKDKNYPDKENKKAETRLETAECKVYIRKKSPFFRLLLKKMEAEFPVLPEVQEWREV